MVTRITMIVVILVLVLGGGFFAYQQLVPPPDEAAQGPIYSTQEVTRGDIDVGVEAIGPLNPSWGGGIQVPGNYRDTSGISSYIIDEVLVKPGDFVKQGQVLVRLLAPDLDIQLENALEALEAEEKSLASMMGISVNEINQIDPGKGIILRAPIDGRVMDLDKKEGEEVLQGQIVARIVDDSRFQLIAKLTPSEFNMLTKDQAAVLNFSDFFSEFIPAEIVDINPNPVPESSRDLMSDQAPNAQEESYEFVYWVTLEGENPGLVRPGMRASIGLVKAEDVKNKNYNLNTIRWLRYTSVVDKYASEERVLSQAESIITEIFVHKMETVKAGDPIASLAGQDVRDTIEEKLANIRNKRVDLQELRAKSGLLEVRAPMDGIVADLNRQQGGTVQPGEWLGSIFQASDMRIWTQVDDVDILLVKQGAPVDVTVDALPGAVFKGEVEQVDVMGQDEKGVARFGVTIKVAGGPELKPGMQAKAYIKAGSAKNVLLVPLEAVFQEDGQNKVEVLEADGTPKVVAVELGLMNDRVAEVKSGLSEGQKVITGSTADLLPSQKIQSDNLLPSGQGDENNGGEKEDNEGPQGGK
ncbi:MAG: efflux RND transporter periplasmic adaptor subunit [Bacillota bacterium]|jgi:HlyD family secretion protein|nr:efflux RND transporter periplasmic adaptor subunit [Clostridia bacterium]